MGICITRISILISNIPTSTMSTQLHMSLVGGSDTRTYFLMPLVNDPHQLRLLSRRQKHAQTAGTDQTACMGIA